MDDDYEGYRTEDGLVIPKPDKPPKGMKRSNRFWQDHLDRFGECTCSVDDYMCLLGDADFYSDFTDYDMPGFGPLIRAAKTIVKRWSSLDGVYEA